MDIELEPIRRPFSLKDEAYRHLKALILSDRLSGGEMLDLDGLAAALAISRTPLREALVMLEQEGLVETVRYKGTFVVEVSQKDVEEIFQVREALEPLAVRLATQAIPEDELKQMQELFAGVAKELENGGSERYSHSDIEFHDLIIRHCDNKVLQQVLDTLAGRTHRVRAFSRRRSGSHLKESFQEHCLILDALVGRDAKRAEDLMAQHVRNAGKRLADLVPDRD